MKGRTNYSFVPRGEGVRCEGGAWGEGWEDMMFGRFGQRVGVEHDSEFDGIGRISLN